jgi:hypothetical protein
MNAIDCRSGAHAGSPFGWRSPVDVRRRRSEPSAATVWMSPFAANAIRAAGAGSTKGLWATAGLTPAAPAASTRSAAARLIPSTRAGA